MDGHAIEMVGQVGATLAALRPSRPKHEVINHKLAAPTEQICKRNFSARSFELVVLLHLLPRQLAAQPADLVTLVSKFLFFLQKFFAGVNPLVVRNNVRTLNFCRCGCHSNLLYFEMRKSYSPTCRGEIFLRSMPRLRPSRRCFRPKEQPLLPRILDT